MDTETNPTPDSQHPGPLPESEPHASQLDAWASAGDRLEQPDWLPAGVPLARPVGDPCFLPYAPAEPDRRLSALRAGIELLLVIPMAILGAVIGYLLTYSWNPADQRWLHIGDSLGLGSGGALGCVFLVLLGRRKLDSIGWTSRKAATEAGIGIICLVGIYALMIAVAFAIVAHDPSILDTPSAAQQAIEASFPKMSFAAMLLFCLFVAVYEEIVFRGFLLTRLHAIVRRWWLAVAISSLVFALLHLYEGPLAVGMIGLLGLVLGSLFAWRKSLVAPITCHLIHNMVVFMVLNRFSETWT